jgi:two-component system sensor histidine kinase DevS
MGDGVAQLGLDARAVLDAAPDGMVIVADDGRIVAVNSELERQFGYAAEDMLGATIELLVPAGTRDAHVGLREAYVEDPKRREMGVGRHLFGQRRDGSVFPVQISLARIGTAEGAMTFAAVRDVTARVESEEQLADANRRRMLAEDHDRIARDLHDTVIQELFGVGLALQGLQSRITTPEFADRLSKAVDDIDQTIRAIRFTVYELSQAESSRGPRQRIADVVAEVAPSLGFEPHVRFVGPIDGAVPDAIVDQMIHVVREALTNVARHAGGTRADLNIEIGDHVTVEVLDNGRGIGETGRRSGLSNLAHRAVQLGGDFEVRQRDEGGTSVRWSVPLT